MRNFKQEFNTLNFVIKESQTILLFAHSRPDGDTTGSVMALQTYIKKLGKNVEIACYDPFPDYLKSLSEETFISPENIDLKKYDLIIAADSVERGFHKIISSIADNQIVAILDHHPDITIKGDITIIDATYSSVCEIIYDFFTFNKIDINRKMATFLMLGLMS
ncbi:MAG: DHH family phosphoesterase, partial [bacterium]|nr:DHH family phosphoesterase [bacterium]